MWNRDSPLLPTVPGGAQDSKLPHRDQHRSFPPFPSDQAPLLVRPPHTQQQRAPQLDPTTPCRSQTSPDPSPRRAEPLSLSPDLSPQERGDPESRCSVMDTEWNHLRHFKYYWGRSHTNYMKGNLWSEGTKHVYTKRLNNLTWSLGWAALREGKPSTPSTLVFFCSFTEVQVINNNAVHVRHTMWLSYRCTHCVIIITIK